MNAHIFTVGPVEPFPEIAAVRQRTLPYFRTEAFSEVMKANERGLLALLDAPEGSVVVTLASSGTGAMEAAVGNCLDPAKRSLLVEGGAFGRRFHELMERYAVPHDVLRLPLGETLGAEHFAPFEARDYDAVVVNLHETFIGQLYSLGLVGDFARRHGALLMADLIGCFLADPVSLREGGIDVAIVSSQKGLCLSPGMAMLTLSERAQRRVAAFASRAPYYFDLRVYQRNRPRGQTPFTPAVCVAYELQAMLQRIAGEGGREAWLARVRRNKEAFRAAIASLPLTLPDYPGSNLLTPVFLPETCDASAVFRHLIKHDGIYVNPCGGALTDRMLRVAHIGNVEPSDFATLAERLGAAIDTCSRSEGGRV